MSKLLCCRKSDLKFLVSEIPKSIWYHFLLLNYVNITDSFHFFLAWSKTIFLNIKSQCNCLSWLMIQASESITSFSGCPGARQCLPENFLSLSCSLEIKYSKVQLPAQLLMILNRHWQGFEAYRFTSNITIKPQWGFFDCIRCKAEKSGHLCILFVYTVV